MYSILLLHVLLAVLFLPLQLVFSVCFCPPLGPVLPAPRNVSAHPLVRSAAANLTASFNLGATNQAKVQGNQLNVTSFSVNLFSIHDQDSSF